MQGEPCVLLKYILASSPLQLCLWEGSECGDPLWAETCDTELSWEGLQILVFYYYFFLFCKAFTSHLKNDFCLWM